MRTDKIRKYDQQLLQADAAESCRIIEHVPVCWMCNTRVKDDSKEHIFSRNLQKLFPKESLRFSPYKSDFLGQETHRRGPFDGGSLVSGNVCKTCNNNWMSQLEVSCVPMMMGDDSRVLVASEREQLARWFIKMSILFNVSQDFRLLWKKKHRHELKTGIPQRTHVLLYRLPEGSNDLDWEQSSVSMAMLPQHPNGQVDPTLLKQLALSHLCAIQVGRYVGVVVHLSYVFKRSVLEHGGISVVNANPLIDRDFFLAEAPIIQSLTAASVDPFVNMSQRLQTGLVVNRGDWMAMMDKEQEWSTEQPDELPTAPSKRRISIGGFLVGTGQEALDEYINRNR